MDDFKIKIIKDDDDILLFLKAYTIAIDTANHVFITYSIDDEIKGTTLNLATIKDIYITPNN